jgi:hypothetical protein
MRFCITVYGFLAYTIARALRHRWVHKELAPYCSHTGRLSIDSVLMIRILIVRYIFCGPDHQLLCLFSGVALRRLAGSARCECQVMATRPLSFRGEPMTFGPERTAQRKPSTVDTSIACGGAGNFGGIDGRDHPRTGPAKAGNLGGIQSPRSPANRPRKRSAGRLHVRRSRRPLQSPANSYTARTVCAVPAHTHRVAAGARVMPPRGSGRRRKMDERRCVNLGRPHKCLKPIRRRLASCSGASLDGGPY